MKTYEMIYPKKQSRLDKILTWIWFKFHWRIRQFIYSVQNVIRWIPTTWKNRNYDGYYIYCILQKKLEFQRQYLNKKNRFESTPSKIFWMTVCLNLIERVKEEYYTLEQFDYLLLDHKFVPCDDKKDSFTVEETIIENRLQEYLDKNKLTVRKIKEGRGLSHVPDYANISSISIRSLARQISIEKQLKCKKLLFKILNDHLDNWWD